MNVLQINKYLYPRGGAETYMFQLGPALEERGVAVKYWGMYSPLNIVDTPKRYLVDEIDYTTMKLGEKLKSSSRTIYSLEAKRKLELLLDDFLPDIAHIHNFNFQLTPSILSVLKSRGVKIIYTSHDSQLICPYHRLYNFQKNEVCTKCVEGSFFNCIKDRCFDGGLFKSALGALESKFYHSVDIYNESIDAIVSPSRFLANLIGQRFDGEIITIPNFTVIPEGRDGDVKDYVIYFGRISKEKGVVDILQCFENARIKLKVVGGGPDSALVSGFEYVELIGPKYGVELFDLVRGSRFTIQPSLGYENCPMAVIESLGCGTPVMASNHSGFLELIDEGKTGWLVDFTRRKEDVIRSIKTAFDTCNEQLRANCLRVYEEKYVHNVHVPKIMDLYKRLL